MAARSIGSGTIAFGLVSIPVKVYSSSRPSESGVHFHLLNEQTKNRVKQQYVDAATGDLVPRSQMVKGYEVQKGQYVTFTDEELKALEDEVTRVMEIDQFIPLNVIDPIFYDGAYYLGPDKGGDKAYHLLRTALQQSALCGVARWSARGKESLVVLRPLGEALVMQELRWAQEVKDTQEVPLGDSDVKDKELKLAMQLISHNTSDSFDLAEHKDEWRERMLAAINRKVEGQEVSAPAAERPQAQIIDLMEALRASLERKSEETQKPRKAGRVVSVESAKGKTVKPVAKGASKAATKSTGSKTVAAKRRAAR